MNRQELVGQIRTKKSFLCVGLDTDLKRIPEHLLENEYPVFEFNKAIIEATKEYAVAYKINIAFYEAMGPRGWISLQKTLRVIPENILTIADAKRGDIGNTADQYAKTFFQTYPFDAVTVAPYMGRDSIQPFLEYQNKWTIVLGLTSNKGSADFQMNELKNGRMTYEQVMYTTAEWGTEDNLMFVVGATKATSLTAIRAELPNHFFLIPGVGAQGGSLEDVVKNGMNEEIGLLINSSRGIIYASSGTDFAHAAQNAARKLQSQMAHYVG
ncbi:MAG: orotidine-5'-phosphate decarboxylase [Verrucomicrobia bacterium]|nr:orotidine-5'-phosphate decarboxylase [Verrucomicrobiota bacterium]